MTDTLPMPNFWWCPTHHLYRGGTERPCADAVKLGDVEVLHRDLELQQRVLDAERGRADRAAGDADSAERECDALRLEIRAVLDGWRDPDQVLEDIREIVERESSTRCVNDSNGDGDCAACARNPNALCRQPIASQSEVQP